MRKSVPREVFASVLLALLFLSYLNYSGIKMNAPIQNSTTEDSSPKHAGPLESNSILFSGMYYNWTGYFSAFGNWNGSVNYTYYAGNIFNASEYNSLYGGWFTPYTVNNLTRIASGGMNGNGASTPYWIFTNVSISDYVPIAIAMVGDSNFQVTANRIIIYNSAAYQCFVLNDSASGSWAYYEVNTGVLIEGFFAYKLGGNPVNYTLNLAISNVSFPLIPSIIIEPSNQTYYYSQIPIVAENLTSITNAWFRNSSDGGITWSQNYTLVFDGTNFVNATPLFWVDGDYILQVFANTTDGNTSVQGVGFNVDTYGPWIDVLSPGNATFFIYGVSDLLTIDVSNNTYAQSIWFQYLENSAWTQ